jgi:protein ImuB
VSPDVRLLVVPIPVLDTARQALVDVALAFSPHVEPRGFDAVLLDGRGTSARFPTPESLGCALLHAAERAGLRVRVGLARGPRLARIAARSAFGVTVLPAGCEADALARLPLTLLDPSPDLAGVLEHLGIRSIGDFARLGERGIGTRLGPDAMDIHALARGIDRGVLEPLAPLESFQEAVALDYLMHALDPLAFLLSGAIERLSNRMQCRGLAPALVRLSLEMDPEGIHSIEIRLPAPTNDLRSLLSLLRLAIEKTPPPGPVAGFTLLAQGERRGTAQGHLFGPPMPDPGRLADLMGRLEAIAGPGNVGAPGIRDTREPDASTIRPFAPRALHALRAAAGEGASRPPPTLTFRRFATPMEVRVRLRDHVPVDLAGPGLSGPVRHAAGPWYTDAGWWTDRPLAGALYDAEIPGHGLLRLWHDLLDDRWFVDGTYD